MRMVSAFATALAPSSNPAVMTNVSFMSLPLSCIKEDCLQCQLGSVQDGERAQRRLAALDVGVGRQRAEARRRLARARLGQRDRGGLAEVGVLRREQADER